MKYEIDQFLRVHRSALMVAARELQRKVSCGERATLGDLAFVVARFTGYNTKEWQARCILSHAVKKWRIWRMARSPRCRVSAAVN